MNTGLLLCNYLSAHHEAKAFIAPLLEKNNKFINTMSEWHTAQTSKFIDIGSNFRIIMDRVSRTQIQLSDYFTFIANKVDLPLEL